MLYVAFTVDNTAVTRTVQASVFVVLKVLLDVIVALFDSVIDFVVLSYASLYQCERCILSCGLLTNLQQYNSAKF